MKLVNNLLTTILLLLLLLPLGGFAYGPKDIKLTSQNYSRYVRPQLINITQNYHTLIKTMNPELTHLQPLHEILNRLTNKLNRIHKAFKLRQIEKFTTDLQSSLLLFKKGMKIFAVPPNFTTKVNFSPEKILESNKSFYELRNLLFQLQLEYENLDFFKDTSIDYKVSFYRLKKELAIASNLFNIYLVKSSDDRFHSDFLSFWNNFIKPVNKSILKAPNKNLFESKLTELNLQLNMLNIILTKRNKTISKQTATVLKIIHNRWIRILKITLKRY